MIERPLHNHRDDLRPFNLPCVQQTYYCINNSFHIAYAFKANSQVKLLRVLINHFRFHQRSLIELRKCYWRRFREDIRVWWIHNTKAMLSNIRMIPKNGIFAKQCKNHILSIFAEVSEMHWQIENQIKVFICSTLLRFKVNIVFC